MSYLRKMPQMIVALVLISVLSTWVAAQTESAQIYEQAAKDFIAAIPQRSHVLHNGQLCPSTFSTRVETSATAIKTRVVVDVNWICGSIPFFESWAIELEQLDRAEVREYQDGKRCVLHCKNNEKCISFSATDSPSGMYSPLAFRTLSFCEIFARAQSEVVLAPKRALRAKVFSEFKIGTLANPELLKTNVFVYKDNVVGVYAIFDQMVSPSEAAFALPGTGVHKIFVTGVPTLEFSTGRQSIILAVKIFGIKTFKVLGTDFNAPYGNYVGSYKCKMRNCKEFFD